MSEATAEQRALEYLKAHALSPTEAEMAIKQATEYHIKLEGLLEWAHHDAGCDRASDERFPCRCGLALFLVDMYSAFPELRMDIQHAQVRENCLRP
jgi:hypothetical protein